MVPCSYFMNVLLLRRYLTTLSTSIHYLPSVSLLAVSAPSTSAGLGFRSTGGGAGVASDVRDDCEVEGPFWLGELVAELASRWSSALRASALRFRLDTSSFLNK